MNGMNRLDARLSSLALQKKKAFVAFFTAGYPDMETYAKVLEGLPDAGADIIEIGMPFSDPMADGPAIQAANIQAFKAGITTTAILDFVRTFRQKDQETPLVLMGYYNPIYSYGVKRFLEDAEEAGVDAFIVPDLPPEEDAEFREPATKRGLKFIRLVTPTSDADRLKVILNNASGFLYYVSIAGITGSKQANPDNLRDHVDRIKELTDTPVLIGFGVSTPDQAKAIADVADGVIVGSALINRMAGHIDTDGKISHRAVESTLSLVKDLAQAVKE